MTMADQSFIPSSTSASNLNNLEKRESELQTQSETTSSTTQLLERNVKQIQITEESTVKKVLKSREVRHYNVSEEPNPPTGNSSHGAKAIDDNLNQGQRQSDVGHDQLSQSQSHENFHDSSRIAIDGNPSSNQIDDSNLSTNVKSNERQTNTEPFYGGRISNQSNSNYQNLITAAPIATNTNANHIGLISNQIDQQQSTQPFVQPMQRANNRNPNIPQSGYEELDSTLGYNNQQQSMRLLVGDPSASDNYGNSGSIHMQPFSVDSSIMVQHESVPQNGATYMNHKSNYDMAYGTTGNMAQIPIISNNAGIYGTRSVPEPVYAINRNGNITFVAQPNIDIDGEIRWRDPELEEVISFLSNPDPMIRANSVAYLQHLTYADDHIKQKTRSLNGIPILIDLLNRDMLEVQRNVCGALRNLSYGRKNDDNKRAIRDALGIQSLVRTLINNPDNEIREIATSVLWNLSSCEDIKWSIIDDALNAIVSVILIPYAAWFRANLSSAQQFLPTANETHWSTVFRNATGVIRNISSAGPHARKQLRDSEGLIESLFFIINSSINRKDLENKLVENCVCILRNLSYRCQETQDPDYDKHFYTNNSQSDSTGNSMQNSPSSPSSSANLTTSLVGQVSSRVTDNLGCFGFGRKSKSKSKISFLSSRNNSSSQQPADQSANFSTENRSATLLPPHHPSNIHANVQSSTMVRTSTQLDGFNSSNATLPRSGISNINSSKLSTPQGKDLLWQPDVVKPYLALLAQCSNSETLEAAAGAIQNLAACYWQPSIDIRAAVRKERGLPILVELLRMDRDRVVCVVATALRNLAIDQKNKELIGKYAMLDLVNKLISGQSDSNGSNTSDDTIAAVLATLHEVISNNADFARSLYESGGLNKLTYIVRNRPKFSVRVQRFAAQVSTSYS